METSDIKLLYIALRFGDLRRQNQLLTPNGARDTLNQSARLFSSYVSFFILHINSI